MSEQESKIRRITDLETVKKLFRRPPPGKRGLIRYVGTDEDFEKIQRIVAESGAIHIGRPSSDED